MNNIYLSLSIMALTIYCIRLMPFLFIRKPIQNRWFKSFLYYVPYVTLAVMTFPAIMEVTSRPLDGIIALIAGLVVAWIWGDLFAVAITCTIVVFAMQLFF